MQQSYHRHLRTMAALRKLEVTYSSPIVVTGSMTPPPSSIYPGVRCYMVTVTVDERPFHGFGPTPYIARSAAEFEAYKSVCVGTRHQNDGDDGDDGGGRVCGNDDGRLQSHSEASPSFRGRQSLPTCRDDVAPRRDDVMSCRDDACPGGDARYSYDGPRPYSHEEQPTEECFSHGDNCSLGNSISEENHTFPPQSLTSIPSMSYDGDCNDEVFSTASTVECDDNQHSYSTLVSSPSTNDSSYQQPHSHKDDAYYNGDGRWSRHRSADNGTGISPTGWERGHARGAAKRDSSSGRGDEIGANVGGVTRRPFIVGGARRSPAHVGGVRKGPARVVGGAKPSYHVPQTKEDILNAITDFAPDDIYEHPKEGFVFHMTNPGTIIDRVGKLASGRGLDVTYAYNKDASSSSRFSYHCTARAGPHVARSTHFKKRVAQVLAAKRLLDVLQQEDSDEERSREPSPPEGDGEEEGNGAESNEFEASLPLHPLLSLSQSVVPLGSSVGMSPSVDDSASYRYDASCPALNCGHTHLDKTYGENLSEESSLTDVGSPDDGTNGSQDDGTNGSQDDGTNGSQVSVGQLSDVSDVSVESLSDNPVGQLQEVAMMRCEPMPRYMVQSCLAGRVAYYVSTVEYGDYSAMGEWNEHLSLSLSLPTFLSPFLPQSLFLFYL